ncbi:MAG: preprotein translocase subunit SecG [Acidobacteria bacterium]|nr:preprotein translocase subunit SecG [Acidobacteriota bacterium]
MKWTIALLIGFGIILIGFRFAGWLLTIFFVMNCLVLIIVVLLQSGKAADLAGAFGGAGSQTAFGPRGAATLLSQATTWCAVMFMVCAMALVLRVDRAGPSGGSVLEKFSKPAPAKTAPVTPAPVTPAPQSNTTPTPAPAAPSSTPQTTPQSNSTPASKPPASTPSSQPKKQ